MLQFIQSATPIAEPQEFVFLPGARITAVVLTAPADVQTRGGTVACAPGTAVVWTEGAERPAVVDGALLGALVEPVTP